MSAKVIPRCRSFNVFLFFLQLIYFFDHFAGVKSDELQILQELKSALQNSNAHAFESWRSDVPICNFTGILCNSTLGSVTGIELSNRDLAGVLPFDSICSLPWLEKIDFGSNYLYQFKGGLKNCSKLQYLDLAANRFTEAPDFSSLTGLKLLNLSANRFSGPFPGKSLENLTELYSLSLGDNPFNKSPFPAEVLKLRKLNWLYLSNCSLEGDIPETIGDLTELGSLQLADNNLSGGIPSSITKLNKLWQLQLYSTSLTGNLPIGMQNLSNLEYFDASMNKLEGNLTELRYLTKLISLQMFENQFSGEIPPELGDFKNLVNLSLYSNSLSGSIPQKLGSWAEFDFIDISDNQFTGPIPPDMCKKGKMSRLLMLGNQFSGQIPANYENCLSLIRFRVNGNSLSGVVPPGIWSLPNVVIIDLSMNGFEGPVTAEIGNAASLSQLNINNNRFSGELPPEMSKASSLVSIVASYNQFSGDIPTNIGELRNLNSLRLEKNLFSGSIPDSLGSGVSLNEINLAGNSLSGNIPASLGSLPSLNSLNLSDNQLSGQIPASFSSLRLSNLDLSNNRLTGRIPPSLSIVAYKASFVGNPGLCSQSIEYFRQCPSDSGKSRGLLRTLIYCLLAVSAVVLASLACYVLLKKRKSDGSRASKGPWDVKSFRRLTFTEQEVVNSIKQENLIGKGGSGNVYKVVLSNGLDLAVKQIWTSDSDANGPNSCRTTTAMLKKPAKNSAEFEAEVATLSSIRHVNVVKLYCSITNEDWSLLVYEHMPNGSLWDRLHTCQKGELDWEIRYEIAVGAAKGLEYLHHGCERPIIHRDLKSSNILLDEFFKPRIADFGLAKIVRPIDGRDSTQVIAGTHGYIAPEYAYTYKVNEKSDVYSFGVVLMELVTGRKPIEPEFGDNKDIVYWICSQMTSKESVFALIDPRIPESVKEEVVKVLRIGVLCTARLPALRPSMRTVVQMLEEVEPCRFITIKDDKKEGGNSFGEK